MYGAPTLGQWKRSQAVELGFPLMKLRAAIGLFDRVDFGIGLQTYYFLNFGLSVFVKVGFIQGEHWSLSALLEGTGTVFLQSEATETRGARWLTGHRNYGFSPGLNLTYQWGPRHTRVFMQASYLLSYDVESATRLGHNVETRVGAELPLSQTVSFTFSFGLGVHGRPEDSILMPSASLGLVTGF